MYAKLEKEIFDLTVQSETEAIIVTMRKELCKKHFVFIPSEKLGYLEKDELFGQSVCEVFPLASDEIKDAGNCLAADLDTAAVYHLMCAVEHGLRKLAGKLGVKSVKKGIPVSKGTWKEVIDALQAKVNAPCPRSSVRKQKDAEFYNELLIETRAFERFWRNKVMHARVRYTASDAQNTFSHVKRFMQVLAIKV